MERYTLMIDESERPKFTMHLQDNKTKKIYTKSGTDYNHINDSLFKEASEDVDN